jgi:hypothetical protein
MTSVFAQEKLALFPHRYRGQLTVGTIVGGVPTDPKVAEGWLRTKLGGNTDDRIRELVAQTMVERGVNVSEATEIVNVNQHLNGFKRDEVGLYIEGRQLKSALKEAASCAMAVSKLKSKGWGNTNKGLLNFMAEHVFVQEDKLYLGVTEATGVNQKFVHTFRGSGIQYEEFVTGAVIDFTVIADFNFPAKDWAAIWTSGEQQGIGASRSQGYGRYNVTRWDSFGA